ncbi:GNAT family N-acetyltransferase [Vibrio maritimus]|jgi:GNAT superfamily N-acetyltransferase
MNFTERAASCDDFEFLFELKKVAEYEAVSRVFGWDEDLQRQLHENEWSQAKPTIIEVDGKRVGSYLFEPQQGGGYYFGRFFLLPEYQGKGIGSGVLESCITKSRTRTISLCYLIGNQVHSLYERYGFRVTGQDEHFVYMRNQCS